MSSKEDKERAGRERLTQVLIEDNRKRGRDISSREVDAIVQKAQHRADIEGKIK